MSLGFPFGFNGSHPFELRQFLEAIEKSSVARRLGASPVKSSASSNFEAWGSRVSVCSTRRPFRCSSPTFSFHTRSLYLDFHSFRTHPLHENSLRFVWHLRNPRTVIDLPNVNLPKCLPCRPSSIDYQRIGSQIRIGIILCEFQICQSL